MMGNIADISIDDHMVGWRNSYSMIGKIVDNVRQVSSHGRTIDF